MRRWSIGVGIEIDASRLADLHLPNLAFRDKAPQINLLEIEQRDDCGSGCNDFSRFRRTGNHRAIERSANNQVGAIRLCLRKLELCLSARRSRVAISACCWTICFVTVET